MGNRESQERNTSSTGVQGSPSPESRVPSPGSRVVLLAALDRNRAIGRDGAMPWHLSDDLKRFKARTLGKPVLMGRKTALAIGRALPGRENLVLSRSKTAPFAEQRIVHSLDDALELARGNELIVIGGGEVYALTLPHAARLWLTQVDTEAPDADTFFPEFDPRQWRETAREHHPADARHAFAFDFVDYEHLDESGLDSFSLRERVTRSAG